MKKEYNFGLALLRLWMCFEVVLCHFWHSPSSSNFLIQTFLIDTRQLAVPVFMILSFFYTSRHFEDEADWKGAFHKKMNRLYFPHVVWSLFFFFFFLLCPFLLDSHVGLSDLFLQLLTGHSYNSPMWFQSVLIVLTAFFFAFFYMFRKYNVKWLLGFFIVLSLFMQYSGINVSLFDGFRDEFKYPMGRIFEMMPYAVIGIFLNKPGIIDWLRNKGMMVPIVCLALFLVVSSITIPEVEGFYYSGIKSILVSVLLFLTFLCLPLSWMNDHVELVKSLGVTLGIYCIHYPVGLLMNYVLVARLGVSVGGFVFSIFVFVLCFLLAFVFGRCSNRINAIVR